MDRIQYLNSINRCYRHPDLSGVVWHKVRIGRVVKVVRLCEQCAGIHHAQPRTLTYYTPIDLGFGNIVMYPRTIRQREY